MAGAVLGLGGVAGCRAPESSARATTVAVVVDRGAGREAFGAESAQPVCLRGLAGAGSWAVQYTDARAGSTELASLQILAPAGADSPDGTDAVYFGLATGPASSDSAHVVETRAGAGHPQGAGRVVVRGGPDTALIRATGRSGSGAELTATVRCAQVRSAPQEAR